MWKAETELRETISKEREKLLALQERRRQKVVAKTNHFEQESFKEIGGKPRKAEQNAQLQEQDQKTNSVKKYERNKDLEAGKEQQEIKYKTKESIKSSRNVSQQMAIKKTQTTQSTEIKFNEGNYSSSADAKIDLVTCSNCGRSFMKERLAKHEKACKKASSRVKKPFDTKRKRAEGTDMEKYIIIGKDTADDSAYKEKKRNWRRTHENFIQTIRSARRQEYQPATPMTNPDYVECLYCKRKFKQTVAQRHIPRCKDIKARPRPPRR